MSLCSVSVNDSVIHDITFYPIFIQVTARFRTSILLPSETLDQVGEILRGIQQGFDGPKPKKGGKGKVGR